MKKQSLDKIEHISIFGSPNSATLPSKKDNDTIDKPYSTNNNNFHTVFEEKGLNNFSKNIKLAPLKTNIPSSTLNNENYQPNSANYSSQPTAASKQSYLRKSILAAHKMAEEQMKKEKVQLDIDIEEVKWEFLDSIDNVLKKENTHQIKISFDDNDNIINLPPKIRLSQGKKDNFMGVTYI